MNIKGFFRIFSIIFLILILITPMTGFAQAIGETQITSLFKQIMDTIKMIAPYGATAYIGFNAIQVFTDSDNANKKQRLINSVIVSAVVLLLVFGAEGIVEQLKGVAKVG